MNEIESRAVTMRAEESLDSVVRHFRIHGLQTSKCEEGVVKVRTSIAVESRALGRKLAGEESADEFCRSNRGASRATWRS
jgi:hypothetical protein